MAKHDPYAAFRLPDYNYVLGAVFIIGMTFRTQQVAVGWDIYERTGSAMALGWLGMAMFIPVFLLFLPAGQWADRYSRRSLMMLSFALSSLASLGLAFASWTQASDAWIYFAVICSGSAQAISRPARSAILAAVVPAHLLSGAVAWSSSVSQVAQIGGPALAGILIAASGGATLVYILTFALNVLGLLCVARVRYRKAADNSGRRLDLRHLFAGLVHVWKTKVIFATIFLDLVAVLFGGAVALLPIYAKDILDVGPTGLGWLAAAPAVGSCISAFIMGHLPAPRKAGTTFLWSVAWFGVATIVFGWSTNFWLSFAALFATGALDSISVVIRMTLIPLHTPDELRGRVSAVNNVFISSSNELGAFRAGAMAAVTSSVLAVVAGGFAILGLVALMARLSPELRRLKSMDAPVTPAK